MKTNVLLITACATMLACSNNTTVPNRVELPGIVDNEAFAANVESISVMNLQMDDCWAFTEYMVIGLTDNYLYISDEERINLISFDLRTGEKLSNRNIKGNGPSEILGLNSMFCNGDICCIYDNKGVIRQYDHNCRFVGKLYEISDIPKKYHLVKRSNEKYAFVAISGHFTDETDETTRAIFLTDSKFNITSKHFCPKPANIVVYGGSYGYFDGDTMRFIFPYDNHLNTLYGEIEQSAELVLPNPLTPEIGNDIIERLSPQEFGKYDGDFSDLYGSGRFLTVKYRIDGKQIMSMIDKRTYNAVSIPDVADESMATTANIVDNIVRLSYIIKSDGGCIYARCKNSDLAELLEGHDNLLDDRLKKTQAEYRAFLERNANYIKGLEPEEREVANVLIKIKLKD